MYIHVNVLHIFSNLGEQKKWSERYFKLYNGENETAGFQLGPMRNNSANNIQFHFVLEIK